MNGSRKLAAAILVMVFVVGGCSWNEKLLPNHDEILVYNLPFDLTYLRTLEALETLDDWELNELEKEKGIISVRNLAYGQFGDADKRVANFLVKRVSREQTSVQLAPESQRCLESNPPRTHFGIFKQGSNNSTINFPMVVFKALLYNGTPSGKMGTSDG